LCKIFIYDYIYVLDNKELLIYDKEFNLKKTFKVSNVDIYNDMCIDIKDDLVKIYKKIEFYHTYTLPKKIEKFIISKDYIFSYENSVLSIFSFIGNKLIFNANISKSEIKQLIFKEYLYILTTTSIMVLDLLKKKIIFNKLLKVEYFDTDGRVIIAFGDNTLYKIENDNIEKFYIKLQVNDLKYKNGYILLRQNQNLYIFDTKLYLVTSKCNGFNVEDDKIYVLEDKFIKYDIKKFFNQNRIKVLTVDDSTTMRLIIKNSIINNFKNIEVYEAKNGKIALQILKEHPDMDIIFMDWNMPVMNGRDTVIKIRENPKYNHIKIIMATTENDKDKIQEMIKYGVKGYLIKPLKASSVVPVTQRMIELIKEEKDV